MRSHKWPDLLGGSPIQAGAPLKSQKRTLQNQTHQSLTKLLMKISKKDRNPRWQPLSIRPQTNVSFREILHSYMVTSRICDVHVTDFVGCIYHPFVQLKEHEHRFFVRQNYD